MSQPQNSPHPFSISLRILRGPRNQREFARFLGLRNQQTYQRYEAGRVPRSAILQRIASKLNVTVDDLLSGEATRSSLAKGNSRLIGRKFPLINQRQLQELSSAQIEQSIAVLTGLMTRMPAPARHLLRLNIQLLLSLLEQGKTEHQKGAPLQ